MKSEMPPMQDVFEDIEPVREKKAYVVEHRPSNDQLIEEVAVARPQLINNLIAKGIPPQDVEDIAQDALVAGIRNIGSFDGGYLVNWLTTIGYHRWLNTLKKKALKVEGVTTTEASSNVLNNDEMSDVEDFPDREGLSPDDELIRKEEMDRLHSLLNDLPTEKHKEVMELCIEGYTPEEIATRLNIEISKIYGLIAYSRKIMKKKRDFQNNVSE